MLYCDEYDKDYSEVTSDIMRIGDEVLSREIQIGDRFPTGFGIYEVIEIKGDICLCSNEYTINPISFSKNEIRKYIEFQ